MGEILNFISQNLFIIIVSLFVLVFIILAIIKRELIFDKIANEQVSFIALVFSASMALIGFFNKPDVFQSTALSVAKGEPIRLIFPFTAIFVIASIILLVVFLIRSKK